MSLGIKRKKTVVDEPKIHFSWKEAKRQKSLLIWSGIIIIYGIIFYSRSSIRMDKRER